MAARSTSSGSNRRRLLRGAERLTDDQRTTLFAEAAHRRSPRGHRRRLDRQELLRDLLSCAERGGLRLRDHRRALPVLPLLRILLRSRRSSTRPHRRGLAEPTIAALQTGLSNAAPKATTASSNTSTASPFGSATPTTNAVIRWACTADHGRSRPSGANALPLRRASSLRRLMSRQSLYQPSLHRFAPVIPPSMAQPVRPQPGASAPSAALEDQPQKVRRPYIGGRRTSGHSPSGGIQLALSVWLFTAMVVIAMSGFTTRFTYRDTSAG